MEQQKTMFFNSFGTLDLCTAKALSRLAISCHVETAPFFPQISVKLWITFGFSGAQVAASKSPV